MLFTFTRFRVVRPPTDARSTQGPVGNWQPAGLAILRRITEAQTRLSLLLATAIAAMLICGAALQAQQLPPASPPSPPLRRAPDGTIEVVPQSAKPPGGTAAKLGVPPPAAATRGVGSPRAAERPRGAPAPAAARTAQSGDAGSASMPISTPIFVYVMENRSMSQSGPLPARNVMPFLADVLHPRERF